MLESIGRVGIWAGRFDELPISAVREAAGVIEDVGYGALWLHETTGREVMAQAGILLSATRRIVVATGGDIYARDAVSTAAAQRTFDEAFPGRFLLGLWESHPSLAADVRGHEYRPPVAAMTDYLSTLDTARYGPATSRRLLMALATDMLRLARERTGGAQVLGMPVEYTRIARTVLGPHASLAVVQFVVLDQDRSTAAELPRDTAAAALPNRRVLLESLGFTAVDALGADVVDALVVSGSVDDVERRVEAHIAAGADHFALHVVDAAVGAAPLSQWQQLATRLVG